MKHPSTTRRNFSLLSSEIVPNTRWLQHRLSGVPSPDCSGARGFVRELMQCQSSRGRKTSPNFYSSGRNWGLSFSEASPACCSWERILPFLNHSSLLFHRDFVEGSLPPCHDPASPAPTPGSPRRLPGKGSVPKARVRPRPRAQDPSTTSWQSTAMHCPQIPLQAWGPPGERTDPNLSVSGQARASPLAGSHPRIPGERQLPAAG